jgi:hypothetical protein
MSGRVTDESGAPIAGVSVVWVGLRYPQGGALLGRARKPPANHSEERIRVLRCRRPLPDPGSSGRGLSRRFNNLPPDAMYRPRSFPRSLPSCEMGFFSGFTFFDAPRFLLLFGTSSF